MTGGGAGLGRLLSMRLSRLGVKVILWDISQQGKYKYEYFTICWPLKTSESAISGVTHDNSIMWKKYDKFAEIPIL